MLLLRLHSFTVLDACSSQAHGDVVAPGTAVANCIPQIFLSTDLPKLTSDELTVHEGIALNAVKSADSQKWSMKKMKSYISDGILLSVMYFLENK